MGSPVKEHIEKSKDWFWICPVDTMYGKDAHLAIARVDADSPVAISVWVSADPNSGRGVVRQFAFWIPKEHAAKFIADYKKRTAK